MTTTLYAVTTLLSALLLFSVQPLIGKYLLPWFGGGFAVWSTSLLFFQVMLLAGYLYSHWLVRTLSQSAQARVHLALLAISVALLLVSAVAWPAPILPGPGWQPPSGVHPVVRLMAVLGAGVGVPYFVLAATSPLMQAWKLRAPYRLYALSNAGSLLALVAYPLVLAPALTVRTQARVWSLGYGAFVVGVGAVAWARCRGAPGPRGAPPAAATPLAPGRVALWLALSAVGAALLVATTNQVTQNVAAVPLLWVLPLALYLLSFVLCFAGFGGVGGWRYAALILLAAATLGVNRLLPRANAVPFAVQISLYSLTLFIACMACHGELVRLRPDPARLTAFYLALSLGGALGSAAVNLLAPVVLDNFWEFPLGLLACWGLLLVILARDRTLARDLRQLGVMGCVVMLVLTGFAFRAYRRSFHHTTFFVGRDFYGVVRVQRRTFGGDEPVYAMIHGTTIHGVQATSGAARRRPTAYYGPGSGVGRVLAHLDGRASPLRVGVLGLGTGGLAAYGRAGDGYRFYEIDPQVIRLAQGAGGYFDYVPASPAAVQIVQGDARLSLERELAEDGPAHYDLLVLDVFSADAVPVHFLTVEGFALYLAHLAEGGVLAVNASTTHLDLLPLLERLAVHFHLAARGVVDRAADQPCCASRWVLMARDPDRLDVALGDAGTPLPPAPEVRLWTDDYSNLLQIVRW